MTSHPSDLWRNTTQRYQEVRPAKLVTWSTIHAAPAGYETMAPYIVAIVEFADKTRATVQLADLEEQDLKHGMKLRPIFRKMYTPGLSGVIPYGTKYTVG